MRDTTRSIVTLLIWLGFLVMMGSILTTPTGAVAEAEGGALLGIMAVAGLVAIVMTFAVWNGGFRDPNTERDMARAGRGKSKRTGRNTERDTRIERLIESLDDEEVYELEALLLRDQEAAQPDKRRSRS